MAKSRKPNIAALVRAAKDYDRNLMGRSFLVIGVSRDGDVEPVELRFAKGNFRHLTGARTRTGAMSPDEFFDRCVEGRLAESDLLADTRGHAALKLRAARALFAPGLPVTAFGRGNHSHLLLSADRAIGGKSGVLGLKRVGAAHVPITLLDANIRDEATDLHGVVAVFSKRLGEREYGAPESLRETAMGKPVDWEAVRNALPEDLRGLDPRLWFPDLVLVDTYGNVLCESSLPKR